MANSFFPRIWRFRQYTKTEQENNMPIGEYNLERFKKKLKEIIETFVKSVFNYQKIEVRFKKISTGHNIIYDLEERNGHLEYFINFEFFDQEKYQIKIINIPASKESQHIKVFFEILREFITYFNDNIKANIQKENGRIIATSGFGKKSEMWLYNIQRTLIIEYIYSVFNARNENYENQNCLIEPLQKYDLDLINKILDFSYELSTKKIENKEIFCGFIFHNNVEDVISNSITYFKFSKDFEFGNFSQLKGFLEISNGKNIFFNVTDNKVTHLLITKNSVNEIKLDPIENGKTFQNRPLILSIQGNGKINILEGRPDYNRVLLQIVNSKPQIKDNSFIENFIVKQLQDYIGVDQTTDRIDFFSKWIISLSIKKHGTSLIFLETNPEIDKKFVKTVKIVCDNYLGTLEKQYPLYLVNSITNPDGAVIFNKELIATNIGTILPMKNSTQSGGGSRHNSVLNFTKNFKCLGIVISEDGPITIFKNGKELIKF